MCVCSISAHQQTHTNQSYHYSCRHYTDTQTHRHTLYNLNNSIQHDSYRAFFLRFTSRYASVQATSNMPGTILYPPGATFKPGKTVLSGLKKAYAAHATVDGAALGLDPKRYVLGAVGSGG